MFKDKDGEELRQELGLTDKRADELIDIVQTITNQEAPEGEYGRTSHVMLSIAGRKDLTDVEKVACTFLFCCRTFIDDDQDSRIGRISKSSGEGEREREREREKMDREMPRIFPRMPHGIPFGIPFGMSNLKGEEFVDIDNKIAGMIVAPEGADKSELIHVLTISLVSMLRDVPKEKAREICRHLSIEFARMSLSGDIKL